MRLSEYLIEAVAKRKSGKYSDFPSEPDKELVVHFLKTHGFREVKYGNIHKEPGRVYCFGNCSGDPATHWIRFIDNSGEHKMYFCRIKYVGGLNGIDFEILNGDGSRVYIGNNYHNFAKHVEEEFC
jgi:hypothetical protein